MKTLKYIICATLLAFAFGCASVTPQQVAATADLSYSVAVDALNIAYASGKLSKADHDAVQPYVDAADQAIQKYEADVTAGNTTELQRDLDAFNAALQPIAAAAAKVHK